jgi:AhpC/TSA family
MSRAPALAAWVALWVLYGFGPGPGDRRPFQGSLEAVLPDDGRPALIVFFSTGCPPCFDDLLEMVRFVRDKGLGLTIVGVCGGPEAEIESFVDKYSVRVPIVRDGRGRIRRRFKVDLLPYKIVMAGGQEVYRDDYYLPLDERTRRVRRCLIDLGAGSPPDSPS